ncbi:MAG: ABC transporter ATP-binding protein [Dehalococcoidales bacterium]
MLKLIKHLKPFGWVILTIFALLFGQAMSDLSLPSYMSKIVDVGIQQGGVEKPVPEVIREGEFNKITLFMTDEDQEFVGNNYILLDKQSLSADDYNKYLKSYPALASNPLYKLNTKNNITIDQLGAIFEQVIPVVAAIEQGGTENFPGDVWQIPEGTDPFEVIAALPPAQWEVMRDTILDKVNTALESVLKQYAIAYISAEYKTIGVNVNSMQTVYMLKIGALMLLLTLASAAASIAVGFLSARVAAGLGRNLRKQLFERVESFSGTEFDRFSTASLITRTTNDITQIQMLMVLLFRIVFYAPLLGIGGVIKVIGTDSSMLWIIAAAVAVLMTLMAIIFAIALPKFRIVQKLVDRLNLVTREMLTGQMVIRAFNTQGYEESKFDVANKDITKTNLFINRIMVFMMPAMMFLMNAVMILIMWVGSHQVDIGSMQVGSMMAVMQYGMQIIMAFLMISIVFVIMPRASVAATRVTEVIETQPTINDPQEPQVFDEDFKGIIEFKNVSFRYPGAEDDVLKNITFTSKPGQTTAIIGSTGSGKSTLINLIPRFYDVTGGSVTIDGIDVRSVTQHNLRDKIGYVPQKATLFSGTIGSNIRYADEDATDEEITKFAKTAQALDFISESESGFETAVSQGGANLSGGQKQRLSIARALAKKSQIYLFDDSLSALDYKTDKALRKAMKKGMSNATVLIVTQRVSTVMNADQIVVLNNGEVSCIGTHKELMEKCNIYQEIASSQLSKEELL